MGELSVTYAVAVLSARKKPRLGSDRYTRGPGSIGRRSVWERLGSVGVV